ncbi:hypothetical protein GW17_00000822 [Ensete ventricosum]|nr:hypothetical protein GW17_00000822 [Ensete ventricosum]
MEEITDGVNNLSVTADSYKKNRIQVSNTKKPLFFYVNLAKRYMQQHNEVELSALGMEIMTSTVDVNDESRGRPLQKAKKGKRGDVSSSRARTRRRIVSPRKNEATPPHRARMRQHLVSPRREKGERGDSSCNVPLSSQLHSCHLGEPLTYAIVSRPDKATVVEPLEKKGEGEDDDE